MPHSTLSLLLSRPVFLALGLFCAVSLSACGKKGPLEPPPKPDQLFQSYPPRAVAGKTGAKAGAKPTPEQTEADLYEKEPEEKQVAGQPPVQQQLGVGRKRPPPITPPNKPFFLDPLLD